MNAILNKIIYFEEYLTHRDEQGHLVQCFDKCGDFNQSAVEFHFNNRAYIALAGVAQWIEHLGACDPKGRRFDSQSGHMPGLQTRSPVGSTREATTH